jgi:hypothetical protein
MSWDQGLADAATAYASRCVFGHSDDRINTGENLAYSTGLDLDIADAVALWAGEYRFYDFAENLCNSPPCGHYTQIVWFGSLLVGCGEAVCSPLRLPSGAIAASSARYHVCRYAPAGNIVGERPYTTDAGSPAPVPEYSEVTEELTIPYALIWYRDNLVQPVAGALSLVSTAPIRFELSPGIGAPPFRDDFHVSVFDVESDRLFLPAVDTLLSGSWARHSAVLEVIPGGTGMQFELRHFD